MNNPVIYIVIAIALIGNVYLITKSVSAFIKYSSSDKWLEVEGTLKSSEYQKVVKSDKSGAASWESYEVFLNYRYKAKGSIYTHQVIQKVATKEQAQAFQQGETRIFYFDPAKPEQAMDEKSNILDLVGVIGALLVFNLFTAGVGYQAYSFFSEGI